MLAFIAVIRPQRAEALCQRLLGEDFVHGLTAMECRGAGRQKDHLERYRQNHHAAEDGGLDVLPKVVIEGVIARADQERLIEAVCGTSRTGRIGDGKLFFIPVERWAES
jgi:nitrogen regulatory protein P-II 1